MGRKMSDPGFRCKRCGKPSNHKGYDACMVTLINALNRVGIKTVEHCCGHGKTASSLLIELDSLETVEILPVNDRKGLWLTWRVKK